MIENISIHKFFYFSAKTYCVLKVQIINIHKHIRKERLF